VIHNIALVVSGFSRIFDDIAAMIQHIAAVVSGFSRISEHRSVVSGF
jgi:hypothetical protein